MRRADQRVLPVNLWVPNGLIVGCEALLLSHDTTHAGGLLAAGAGGEDAWQGLGAGIAGVLAQGSGPAVAIAVAAGVSLVMTFGTAGRVWRLGYGDPRTAR